MASHFEFRGMIVPLMTPLTDGDEVDVPSLRRLVRYVLDGGVDGLWVLGAVGQFFTLSERQRDIVTNTVLESVEGRLPVLIGCLDSSPDRCIERARRALSSGADGIFATAPIFEPVAQVEILSHFRRIREAVDLPLVAYNAQYATQTPFMPRTVRTLAEEGTLSGIKDSADFPAFRRLLMELADLPTFRIVTGHTNLADAALMMGAAGCVPTYANLVPALYAALYRCAIVRDWESVRTHQEHASRVDRLIDAWGPASVFGAFLGAVKTALHMMGIFSSANPGRPYSNATVEQVHRIGAVMDELGLPEVTEWSDSSQRIPLPVKGR